MPDTSEATDAPRVAVLGVGIMGAGMARNLLRAGLPTIVWDRSPTATAPLGEAGATTATSAGEAVRDASVVITMLPTADIVSSLIFDDGVIDAFAASAVWAQMGTIGATASVELSARVHERRRDLFFVDAPVSGSKGPAETGQLLILASGPRAAAAKLERPFAAIGRKTVWVGDVGQGSRLKLAVNAYLSVLIEGVAETLALASSLGVDATTLADAIEGGPLDAPIANAKLHKMLAEDYAPEFPLQWALKDVDLALHTAPGADLPVLEALAGQWKAAVDAGHGREDVSAARLALGHS